MNTVLCFILIVTPLPLIIYVYRKNIHLLNMPAYMALLGIYLFDVFGVILVVDNKELFNLTYYFSLLILMGLFYIFFFLLNAYKNKLLIKWNHFHDGQIGLHVVLVVFLWFWAFSLIGIYIARHGLPVIFGVSFTEFTDIYALRAEKTTNLLEGSHWYNLGFITIPSLIIVYCYVLRQKNAQSVYAAFYYINLVMGIVVMAMNMTKSPYFYLIVYLIIARTLLTNKAPSIRQILVYSVVGIVSFVIILRVYLLDRGVYEVLLLAPSFLFERLFGTYSEAHAYITKIFPAERELFYGFTFSNPGGIFPFTPSVNLSQYLGFLAHGSALENYSFPSFSEGFANFGWPGFFLIVFVMFIQIVMLQVVFKLCPKNALSLTIYVILTEKMLHYGIEPIQLIIPEEFIFFCLTLILVSYLLRMLIRDARSVF